MPGYTFGPASAAVTVSTQNETVPAFTAAGIYTISGTITGPVQGNATITLSGAADDTVTTNTTGAYSFTTVAPGNYTITPSHAGYIFTPASTNLTINADTTAVDFTSIAVYTISGTVSDSGIGIGGATMTLSGATEIATTTDSSGNYLFTNIVQGTYTLSPSLTGYAFSSMLIELTLDMTGVNFEAMPPWAGIKQFGSTSEDDGWACHEDLNGNVFVAGKTLGDFAGNTNSGNYDIFIRKYNVSGVYQWTVQTGSTGADHVFGITTDTTGNIYIVRHTNGDMEGINSGEYDIFIQKYTNDGVLVWTRQTGTPAYDSGRTIATDSNFLYITGTTKGDLDTLGLDGRRDVFVMQYDMNGVNQWIDQQGTTTDEEGRGGCSISFR